MTKLHVAKISYPYYLPACMRIFPIFLLLVSSTFLRGAVLDVSSLGAVPDDSRDDSAAIQAAVDASNLGDTILFPSGVFRVISVRLKPGRRYEGAGGAVIQRHGRQDGWTRTFTTEGEGYQHVDDNDSAPLVVTGLTFDGNLKDQGPYQKYEKEHAHLLFLDASPRKKGRLRAEVSRCVFRNCVADGLSIHVNVDAAVTRCRAWDCFRGGVVLTGGHSRLLLRDFEAGGNKHDTGIDIEVDGEGYGRTQKIEARLEDVRLQGDFDIAVTEKSRVEVLRVKSGAPFYVYAKDSSVRLQDSQFQISAADGYENRVVMPGDVYFDSCVLTTVLESTGDAADSYGLEVYWEVGDDQPPGQKLTFKRTQFLRGPGFSRRDRLHALLSKHSRNASGHRLLLEGCSLDSAFSMPIVIEDGGVPAIQRAGQTGD